MAEQFVFVGGNAVHDGRKYDRIGQPFIGDPAGLNILVISKAEFERIFAGQEDNLKRMGHLSAREAAQDTPEFMACIRKAWGVAQERLAALEEARLAALTAEATPTTPLAKDEPVKGEE